jgi:hypothetical protein
MHAIREREQPYAITSFWVFTLALFLSLCTKWLAKPDQFAAFPTSIAWKAVWPHPYPSLIPELLNPQVSQIHLT